MPGEARYRGRAWSEGEIAPERDLLAIGQAASLLNVTRPAIYRWLDERGCHYLRDEVSGRTFVLRRDIAALQAELDAARDSPP